MDGWIAIIITCKMDSWQFGPPTCSLDPPPFFFFALSRSAAFGVFVTRDVRCLFRICEIYNSESSSILT